MGIVDTDLWNPNKNTNQGLSVTLNPFIPSRFFCTFTKILSFREQWLEKSSWVVTIVIEMQFLK